MAKSRAAQEALMALAMEDSQTSSELPDMVVDYLDLLLQEATEPEVALDSPPVLVAVEPLLDMATDRVVDLPLDTPLDTAVDVPVADAPSAEIAPPAPLPATVNPVSAPSRPAVSMADIEAAAEAAFAALEAPVRMAPSPAPVALVKAPVDTPVDTAVIETAVIETGRPAQAEAVPEVEVPFATPRSESLPEARVYDALGAPEAWLEEELQPQDDHGAASNGEPVSLAPISDDMVMSCLRVRIGEILLLVPMDQVVRVEEIDVPRRFEGICVPELPSNKACLLTCTNEGPGIYIDKVEGVERVLGERVRWRHETSRSPWFIGTHKDLLCRVLDPARMLKESLL